MNEFYTMKNQNPSTAEIFRLFNKMPNQKEGESEMGMDNYEQKNLQTILCRLNEAESENQKLKAEIDHLKSMNAIVNWLRQQKDYVSEFTVKFRERGVF